MGVLSVLLMYAGAQLASAQVDPAVGSCPWLQGNVQANNELECVDGERCVAISDGTTLADPLGWSCCNAHGGRARCPWNFPFMCEATTCAPDLSGVPQDHCCEDEAYCISNYGGVRGCDLVPAAAVNVRIVDCGGSDLNDDRTVDVGDLLFLLAAYDTDPSGDIDGNGVTGVSSQARDP